MEEPIEEPDEEPKEQTAEEASEGKEISINQVKLDRYIEQLKLDQNLPMGVLAGLVASVVGAILWAVITVVTEYQIGYMAIAVGFMVGYSIKIIGKGIDNIFGIIGATLALFGCLLGNFLSLVGFFANAEGLGYFETLSMIDYSVIPGVMMESFDIMDLLFYGFAIYEGYKFSFRRITDEEIIEHAAE